MLEEQQPVEEFVRLQLENGKFKSREELVEKALRLLQARENTFDELADMLRPGVERFLRGEEGIEADADDIIRRGMERVRRDTGT